MRSKKSYAVAIVLVGFLLSFPMFLSQPLAASSGTADHRLGFWLQESNIESQYSAQTFFDTMFLTPPYPSSLEVMMFSIQQAESNSQPCSSSSAYIAETESYWGTVAQMADSYPNIQLVYEIAFVPSSSTYGLSCFESMASYFAQYSSVYGIGVEGEYTNPSNGLTQSILDSACSYVASLSRECISYYITENGYSIPSGAYLIAHTNFPGGDSGGYDQVGDLSSAASTASGVVGLDSGYYTNFQFPGTVTCPIGPDAMDSSTAGWNQCVEQTELSTAIQQPTGTRLFLELDVGFSESYFTGVSGISTEQVWDNPTLRNWIWTDANYQPNFILSNGETTTSTSTTSSSTTSSSTTQSSTTSTQSSTTSSSSTTTSSTSSTSTSSTSTTSSSTSSSTTSTTTSDSTSTTPTYALSMLVACPTGTSSCGTTSPSGTSYYPSGTLVTATATANPGFQFSYWTICPGYCGTSSSNPLSFSMLTSGNITANFVSSSSGTTTTTTSTASSSTTTTTSSTTTDSTSTSTTSTSSTSSSTSTSTVYSPPSGSSSTQASTTLQEYPLVITGVCPATGAGLYPAGSDALVTFPGVCDRSGGSGTRVTSWSLNGGGSVPVLTNGTVTLTIPMDGPNTVGLDTVTQYALDLDYGAQLSMVSITQPSIAGDYYWYDAGTAVTFAGSVQLQNFTVVGYGLDGGAGVPVTGPEFVTTFMMNEAHTLHVFLGQPTQSCPPKGCANNPTFDVTIQTNAGQPSGAWVDGAYYPKAVTFAWEAGSVHNITAAQGVEQASVRTEFSNWSGMSDSESQSVRLVVNESGLLTADYSTLDLVHLAFTDAYGGPLTPQSVTLDGPSGPVQLGVNQTAWVAQGGAYELKSVTWLGWNVMMSNDSTFRALQPETFTFLTGVYPQTVKVTDAYGLPVQGAGLNITALDGASISLVTDGQGTATFRLPEGLFSATVSYLGVSDQIVSSTEGSHTFAVSFILSYPLIATMTLAAGVVAMSLAFFKFRKKPAKNIYMFSDS